MQAAVYLRDNTILNTAAFLMNTSNPLGDKFYNIVNNMGKYKILHC